MARDELLVEFFKGERNRYRSLLHRADGLVVEFEGGAYNRVGVRERIPHDLAHLVVEQELGLAEGVWGVLAAGGMFRHTRVVEGRRRAHAGRHGRAVIDAAGDRIMGAEVLVRAVCDVCDGTLPRDLPQIRKAVSERWWSDTLTLAALDRCQARLRAGAREWAALPPGTPLTARWPAALRGTA